MDAKFVEEHRNRIRKYNNACVKHNMDSFIRHVNIMKKVTSEHPKEVEEFIAKGLAPRVDIDGFYEILRGVGWLQWHRLHDERYNFTEDDFYNEASRIKQYYPVYDTDEMYDPEVMKRLNDLTEIEIY